MMPRSALVLVLLALTQITGWGVVGILPVVAAPVAQALNASAPSVFLGTSVMYVAMGLAAPLAGWAFRMYGTRQAMAAGSGLIGLELIVLALSRDLTMFWGAWGLIGVAGALFLTTAAYAYIAEYAEDRARSLMGTLMLATGLASSIFLPLTALLDALIGWRSALFAYAAVMVLIVCPLVRFGLPATSMAPAKSPRPQSGRRDMVFALLVAAIALNSFVTFGIQAVGVPLMQAMGMDLGYAIGIASLLGVFKVGGRVVDLLGGQRWDGLSTGVVSGAMIPLGLAAMWLGGAGWVPVMGYLLLFGVGSGAFAVARATMPLAFFQKADYTAAMATIALPMNLINALAPPVIAALMTGAGAPATFATLGGLSLAAFAALLRLHSMRGHKS